jgi:hypothetical protein
MPLRAVACPAGEQAGGCGICSDLAGKMLYNRTRRSPAGIKQ